MTFLEFARQWTILILAETLRMSASAVAAILPFQPRWLANINLLASRLHAAATRGAADEGVGDKGEVEAAVLPSLEAILASHTLLCQAMADIVARGLALDAGLLARMRADWNVESVVGYLSTAENNLRERVSQALDQAAAPLGTTAAAMTALANGSPSAQDTVTSGTADAKRQPKPIPTAAKRHGLAR